MQELVTIFSTQGKVNDGNNGSNYNPSSGNGNASKPDQILWAYLAISLALLLTIGASAIAITVLNEQRKNEPFQ